jgi:hypothetical protein
MSWLYVLRFTRTIDDPASEYNYIARRPASCDCRAGGCVVRIRRNRQQNLRPERLVKARLNIQPVNDLSQSISCFSPVIARLTTPVSPLSREQGVRPIAASAKHTFP